jgi:hypothetical protein
MHRKCDFHAVSHAAGFSHMMIPGEPENPKEEHRRERNTPAYGNLSLSKSQLIASRISPEFVCSGFPFPANCDRVTLYRDQISKAPGQGNGAFRFDNDGLTRAMISNIFVYNI